MFKGFSLVPLLGLRRGLTAAHDLIGCVRRESFTLSGSLELHAQWGAQWGCILRYGQSRPLTWDGVDAGIELGFDLFTTRVAGSIDKQSKFIYGVVVCRRDSAIRGWRNGRNRLWPIRLWPSLSDRLWPNRLWPNRLWPTLRF